MENSFLVALLVAGGLVMAGILVSPLSKRLGMPVLLLFLAVGMLAGEDGPGKIRFDDFRTSFLISNLALAVILLDGGMRTRIQSFRVALRPALVLASLGVVLTALVGGVIAAWLLDLPLLVGLLLGSIVSSTDAAVVFNLLQGKGLSLNERVKATLEIESGSNDPMAIFLTVMFIDLIQNPGSTVLQGLLILLQQFGIGGVAGILGGYLMARLLRYVEIIEALYPLLMLSAGLVLFSLVNLAGGSGFLAIYLMGVMQAALPSRHHDAILQIQDGLAWLAQLVLFLLLGLLVTPSALLETLPQALLVSAALILVARPVSTVLGLLPFGFAVREHVYMAWVGLRGAVPVVLAVFPLMYGVEHAQTIFQVAFVVVLVSLLLQGSTLAPMARRLNLEVPPRPEPQLRVPLQVPAAGEHELLLFPLKGERWRKPVDISDIHLPDTSRVVMFFRDGEMFERRRGYQVHEGDVLAVFAHKKQENDVGQILGWEEPPERLTDRRFFGDFTISGTALLRDIQAVYGVTISKYPPELSLSGCFAKATRGHPVQGDRIDLGSVMLVAREVVGDQVVKVGLRLSK